MSDQRFNTGNPIGSNSPLDRSDNTRNLDVAVNSDGDTFQDRMGKSRLAWAGMENRFRLAEDSREQRFADALASVGYVGTGPNGEYQDYAAGIEVTEYNQVIRADGEFWKVSPGTDLPYTTTGSGMPEGGAFVSAGDAVLRQQLANPAIGGRIVSGSVIGVSDPSEVSALPVDINLSAEVLDDWRETPFTYESGDLSGLVANDALGIVAVPSEGEDGSTGAWIRNPTDVHDFPGHGEMLRKVRRNMPATSKPINLSGPTIGILGDSISHGAFSRDVYRNNWTNIVKRALLNEYESRSYGFQSAASELGSGETLSEELVKIERSGFSLLAGENAQQAVGGLFVQSVSAGSTLTFSVDSCHRYVGLWFYAEPGGGVVDIEINGAPTFSRDTSVGSGNLVYAFTTSDNGRGSCDVVVRTRDSSPVKITGIDLRMGDAVDFMVCNWSQSGRRLRWMAQEVITEAVKCDSLILALGHNDMGSVETDEAYYQEVRQRIDWLIAGVRSTGTQLYILDFCWTRDRSYRMRNELLRLHRALPTSQLIPFPEYFRFNGAPPSVAELTTTLSLFDDSSHPNVEGHKVIGEMVCAAMGLGIRTKSESLNFSPPRTIKLETGWKNTLASWGQVSAWEVKNNTLMIRLLISPEGGGAFGTHRSVLVGTLPEEARSKLTQHWPIVMLPSGAPPIMDGMITLGVAGDIRITTEGSARTSLPVTLSVPML